MMVVEARRGTMFGSMALLAVALHIGITRRLRSAFSFAL